MFNSFPVRSAHLHASAVGLAILRAGNVQSLEHHSCCHASGILRKHLPGPNRFPCPETWAERSLGAAHLSSELDTCFTCAPLCASLWCPGLS